MRDAVAQNECQHYRNCPRQKDSFHTSCLDTTTEESVKLTNCCGQAITLTTRLLVKWGFFVN